MEHVKEVLIVSHLGSKDGNCTMYNVEDGSLLEAYKEGHSNRNGLDLISDDYLISAFEDKPKIKIWRIGHSNDSTKMTVPGIVSALAVSSNGRYCVAGIGPSIYIWEVASGNLDAHLQYHLQDITCVKFSSDGSRFLTGGKDGMILVFLLTEAIMKRNSTVEVAKPQYTWTEHMNEITDIYLGYMGVYSRVATTSLDRTCRIYELDTGNLLCSIHMKTPLTSVTMDMCEYFLFLGTDEGNIYRINLFNMADPDLHFEDVAEQNVFVGHQKEITSLCVSYSGSYLISGSRDKQCRFWDISSFTCVRQQNYSGPVTNVIASRAPPGIRNKNYIPRLCVDLFKREVGVDEDDPLIYLSSQNLSIFHLGAPDRFFDKRLLTCPADKIPTLLKEDCSAKDMSSVNKTLYSFAVSSCFANDGGMEEDYK